MREIKFRAWSKSFHEMLLCSYDNQYKDCRFMPYGYGLGNKSLIVMQYTGLKDKNGKEIYDSDLIKTGDGNHILEVVYENGSFCFASHEDKVLIPFFHFFEEKHGPTGLGGAEAIGNIYENPELLK